MNFWDYLFQQLPPDPSYGGWMNPAWTSNTPDTGAMSPEGPVPSRLPQTGRVTLPGGPPPGALNPHDLAHLQMLQQGGGQFPMQYPPAGDRAYREPSDLGQFNPGESYYGPRTNQPGLPGRGQSAPGMFGLMTPDLVERGLQALLEWFSPPPAYAPGLEEQ